MTSSANPNNPPQEVSADSATIAEISIHSNSDTTAVMEEATVSSKTRSTTVQVVKVKRPIKGPGSTAARSSGSHRHKKPISKVSNKVSKLTSSTESPKKSTDQSIVQQSTSQIESLNQSEETTKPAQHTNKLDKVSKASRTSGKFHRVYKYILSVAKRADSSSDASDFEDDVSSMGSLDSDSESDDDDDSDHGKDSDSDSKPKATSSESPKHGKRVERPEKEPELEIQVHEEKGNNYTMKAHEAEFLGCNDAENARRVHHKTARRLTRRSASWTRLLIWAIVILLPLFFVCLGVFVACSHNKPATITNLETGIQEASKVAVTVWPIAFAAIAAQSLKALANYKLESGIRLMTVEQLISCHSVAGAIKQPFILRRINWITISLAGLWSLSPLASQAMQRWCNPLPAIVNGSEPLYYLNTAQDNYGLQYVNLATNQTLWNLQDGYLAPMDELFAAAFLPSTEQQSPSSDPWNNPLIPIYEELDLDKIGKDGWVTLPEEPVSVTQFSSLFGVPIVDTDEINNTYGDWNFVIRSSYLYFDCPFLNSTTLDQLGNDTSYGYDLDSTTSETLNSTTLWSSTSETLLMGMTPPYQSIPGTLTFLSAINDAEGNPPGPKGIQTYAYSVCSFNQTFVDSNISVHSDYVTGNPDYTVLAMRKVLLPPTNIGDFMDDFVSASGIGGSEISNNTLTMTERYILNPGNMTNPGKFFINLTAVALPDFTQRLSLLVNTFYSGGFAPQFQTGTLVNTTTVEIYNGPNFVRNQSILASTTANFNYPSEELLVYTVSWVWVIVQEICSVTLLVFGIASVIWEANTLAPDILGFASSVPRKSKYVKLPKLGSTLDGAERAREMADQKVMIQDVKPDDDEGMIVLGNATEEAHRLTLGRLYR